MSSEENWEHKSSVFQNAEHSSKRAILHCSCSTTPELDSEGAETRPVRIGQRVYFPEIAERCREGRVESVIHVGTVHSFNLDVNNEEFYAIYSDGLTYWHGFDDIGKTVFIDKKRAKRQLEKLIKEATK